MFLNQTGTSQRCHFDTKSKLSAEITFSLPLDANGRIEISLRNDAYLSDQDLFRDFIWIPVIS